MSRGGTERAFQKARQHSRIVRALRILLPALVAIATITIVVSTYLSPLLAPLPANIGHVVLSGTKITMERPHMNGFTRDGRPYELKANSAIQDVTKPNEIELHKIDAKIEMQDRTWVRLVTPKGIYDSKNENLKLDRDVVVMSTSGYEGHLKDARVDIRTGHVVTDKPVTIKMLQGTLSANQMEIVNSGDLVRFENGVQLTTYLNTADVKNRTANADDTTGGQANATASKISGSAVARLILIRLPRPDPRRLVASRSTPQRQSPIQLDPQDRRSLTAFTQRPVR